MSTKLTENLHKISGGNRVVAKIAKDIEAGLSFDEILEKHAPTPAAKHEIYYHKNKIAAKIKAGGNPQQVIAEHFKNQHLQADIHKRVAVRHSI